MLIEHDGESVYIATGHEAPSRDKPVLVFIHGAGFDHSVWLMFERYYSRRGYSVVSLDLPGHGRSSGAPLMSIEAMADWVVGVLSSLSLESATVVGHSMGSLVAFECAARHPEKVTKVLLLGFAFPMAVGPPLLEAARANDPSAIDMMLIFGHDFRAQVGGNPVSGVHVINSAKRLLERNAPGVLFADLHACNHYANEAAARQVVCPCYFISGDRDKMTSPKVAKAMAQAVARGEFETIANCGHGVMAEQPEATHRAIYRALST